MAPAPAFAASQGSYRECLSLVTSAPTPDSTAKLVFLVLEQNVEGGHRAVAFGDVLLHLHLFAVCEFFVTVDLLLEHTEVVAHHHDLVKEGFERDFLGLQRGVGGMHYHLPVVPARAEFGNAGVGLFHA